METKHKFFELLGDKIQDIDLTYNINGWLKAINTPIGNGQLANEQGEGGADNTNFAKDVFAEAVNYYRGDYQKLNAGLDAGSATVPQTGSYLHDNTNKIARDLFNGNISSTVTYNAFEPR